MAFAHLCETTSKLYYMGGTSPVGRRVEGLPWVVGPIPRVVSGRSRRGDRGLGEALATLAGGIARRWLDAGLLAIRKGLATYDSSAS